MVLRVPGPEPLSEQAQLVASAEVAADVDATGRPQRLTWLELLLGSSLLPGEAASFRLAAVGPRWMVLLTIRPMVSCGARWHGPTSTRPPFASRRLG